MGLIEARTAMIKMARELKPNDQTSRVEHGGISVEPCKTSGCKQLNINTGCGDTMGPMSEGTSLVCPLQLGEIVIVPAKNGNAG